MTTIIIVVVAIVVTATAYFNSHMWGNCSLLRPYMQKLWIKFLHFLHHAPYFPVKNGWQSKKDIQNRCWSLYIYVFSKIAKSAKYMKKIEKVWIKLLAHTHIYAEIAVLKKRGKVWRNKKIVKYAIAYAITILHKTSMTTQQTP